MTKRLNTGKLATERLNASAGVGAGGPGSRAGNLGDGAGPVGWEGFGSDAAPGSASACGSFSEATARAKATGIGGGGFGRAVEPLRAPKITTMANVTASALREAPTNTKRRPRGLK